VAMAIGVAMTTLATPWLRRSLNKGN